MQHRGTVLIETERLTLRRFVPEDIDRIYRNCWSDPEVWRWTRYAPMPCVEAVRTAAGMFTDAWLDAYRLPDQYNWAIAMRESGDVVGRYCGIHPDDRVGQVELTCEIGRAWWGQGLLTEATRAVLDFFLRDVSFNRVYARCADKNPASVRVLQKCGMVYEGTLRSALTCNAGVFDSVQYSLLASDLPDRGSAG